MAITVQESHRENTSVFVKVVGGTYGRYVPEAEWNADPAKVAAKMADHLSRNPPPPSITAAINRNPVTLTDQEIAAKLAEKP